MINLAIVGATGMVGRKFLEILTERKIDIKNLYLYASSKSAGAQLNILGKEYTVMELSLDNVLDRDIDFALFSAGGKVSKEWAPIFADSGAIVIDNSSAWRMDDDIDLVVPNVNKAKRTRIIANPNCSTIQCVLPLFAILKNYNISQIDFVSFQAVSGSGMKGIMEYDRTQKGMDPQFYPYAIYNNCLPMIGEFLSNGYSEEETKMINETRKILDLKDVKISATCVRVPIRNCHSVSVSVTLDREVDIDRVRDNLQSMEGIVVVDDLSKKEFPVPQMADGKDEVYVGRIRKDIFNSNRLHFWCVADNVRKGAATNAMQILESLIQKN